MWVEKSEVIANVYVYTLDVCSVPSVVRRECWIPWNRSQSVVDHHVGGWELNLATKQAQQAPLTPEPSLHLLGILLSENISTPPASWLKALKITYVR